MSAIDSICTCKESLAMASDPMQEWCEPYAWQTAFYQGTVFPCLNMEFFKAEDIPCPLCNSENLTEREKKMNEIGAISFAINDLTLYLDTHPTCENGLKVFKKLVDKRLNLLAEYAREYNPLTISSIMTGTPETNEYGWGEGPAPWEGGLI